MADENTTDSTPTTEATDQSPAQAGSNGSTTENPSPAETPADGTILGGDPAKEAPAKEGEEPAKEDPAKEGEEPAKEDPAAAFYGAPEGDYELPELPEGMTVDTDALAAVTPIAKELNLSNEGFGKLVSAYAEQVVPSIQNKVVDGLQRDIAAKHAEWGTQAVEMVKTDPVFGGKQLTEIQQVSAKALDRFFGPEFRTFLNETGLGNHPDMLKGMYLAGSAIAEDTTFERGGPTAQPKSRTEKYYGPQT